MEIAKALILVGRGGNDRPWPAAPAAPKQLFPIANRPILFHNLEAVRAAGVLEAAILAEPETLGVVERAVGDGHRWGLSVTYGEWAEGLGRALAGAHDFLADEPVLVQEGGALLHEHMHRHVAAFAREQLDALALQLDKGLPRIPRAPAPGYMLSPRGVALVLEGSDPAANPVAGVRAGGGRVRVQRVDGSLPCLGDQDALLEANRQVLEQVRPAYDGASLDDCRVQGPVVVHPTAHVRRSLLRGPLTIGAGARITDAYVGPYTSVGDGVVIEGAEVEYSIVLEGAQLLFLGTRIESSIIGRQARVARGFDAPATLKLFLGDGMEVILR